MNVIACSGPGALQVMFISTWMGYAHAAATAALLAVSLFVAIFSRRWLMPALILLLLAIHPAWTISAYHGDCGTMKDQACWLFTAATMAMLCWQANSWARTSRAISN